MNETTFKPPTPAEFYIDYPLYEEVTFSEEQTSEGWRIKYFDGTVDTYCPDCGSHSIFSHVVSRTEYDQDAWVYNHHFEVILKCSRNQAHLIYLLFQVRGRTIQKIGQFPSLATLNLYDVKKYTHVLEKEKFRELTTAIGLAAHGVGVGSFVYLRRIFETLVEEAHQQGVAHKTLNEADYIKARMGEKIQLLSRYLPKFLVEHRSMYGILSKGVHELSEDECLKAFPVVKLGIEIILDAKLRALEERKKLEEAGKAILRLSRNS
jgi:predicted RNA-binding Zn-ribbon protein involved in translation (DUF1610 family)